MSYAAAIEQLNAMAPELYAGSGQPRRKFSLDEIGILLAALGNPQRRFPSVLIAGTNGKGSTASTLASILTASGLRTGLYTSPHLARVNERIRLDRAEIADDVFAGSSFAFTMPRRQAGCWTAGCRSCPASSKFSPRRRSVLRRGARRAGGARSGHGRAAGRDQYRRSAALGHHRHFARSHRVAGLHHRGHCAGKGRHSAPPGR
jgi:hypothetical protein